MSNQPDQLDIADIKH